MRTLRRVVSNTVISLFGQVITWTSTFLLTIAYGRFLGDTKFGELYFALSFVALIGFPIEFGFNQQLTRDVAQQPERARRYLANTLALKALFWLLLYSIILSLCWALGYSAEQRFLVAICGLALLSTAITNTFASLHYAYERVVFPVVGTALEKGFGAIAGFILLKLGYSVEVMAFVLLCSSLANSLWQSTWFFRLVGVPLKLSRAIMRDLLLTGIPFLLYGVLGVIYYRLDTVLLSLMTSTTVVGWYGAAYRLFDTLVFLPNLVISAIMYPVFSRLSVNSQAHLRIAIEKSLNFLLFCGLPLATILIMAAPNIIGFLYHRTEFVQSAPVLQVLAPGLVFLYINTVLSTCIISIKKEKKITIMAAAALVFNLASNVILIPHLQHIGAAIVTSLTELLLLCIGIAFVPHELRPTGSVLVGLKVLIASLAMALLLLPLRTFPIYIIVPVALLAYLLVATLLGTIPREDMLALYCAVRHKAQGQRSAAAPGEAAEQALLGEALSIRQSEERSQICKEPEAGRDPTQAR